jgi:malate synthase
MEDAATAEIARCQIWQWIRHGSKTADGQTITRDFVSKLLKEHVKEVHSTLGDEAFNKRKYKLAIQLYEKMLLSDRLEDFLTLVAYPHITTVNSNAAKFKSNL